MVGIANHIYIKFHYDDVSAKVWIISAFPLSWNNILSFFSFSPENVETDYCINSYGLEFTCYSIYYRSFCFYFPYGYYKSYRTFLSSKVAIG